jgi:D-alanyl-D-alanine-carboxypeptidase/D-alanyl-D-alanine-endopeptidase
MKTLGKLLALAAVTISAPAAAQDAAGDWMGTLEVSESVKLPLAVHVRRNDAGTLSGTMDSPSQGAMGIPLAEIVASPGQLAFKVPLVAGSYSARWDEASKTWQGEWSQGGMTWPIALTAAPPPPPPTPLPANWTVPGEAEIAALIADRNAPRAGQGLVVGVLEPGSRRVVAGGPAGGEAFDGNTLFEIGSISKVFTALILADMASKGEVSLDDPAEKYLPAGARMPERDGRKITLADLSTHTSGLPRLPDNMAYGDLDDPYADYTEVLMLEFLGRYELTRDIGSQHEYSNFGVGLLGYLLGRAAGSDYETLLRERVTGPLGMSDTAVTLSPDQQSRFAPGHDMFLRPAKAWRLPVQEGAGGIRSTGNDMLKFAAAVLDPNSPIAAAVKVALAERRDSGNPQVEQALGWQVVHPEPGRELLMHGGATGGYRAELLIEQAKRTAVVVLANSGANPPPTDLAFHILVGSPVAPTPPVPPAPPPAATRAEIALPEAELDRVVGRYEFDYGLQIGVTRDGDALRAQRLGAATSPALQLRAAAPLEFFLRELDIQIRFTTDDAGKVTDAVMTQNGAEQTGRRLDP